ncbi:MAG: hypothetical protein ABIT01_21340, partial [Thermoanaerobaculia bacterium]
EELSGTFLPRLDEGLEPFVVIVNATPVGLKIEDPLPCPESYVREGQVVIDAPYHPAGTRLARLARERGARVFDGYALLAEQAARQAELFTHRSTTPAQLVRNLPTHLRDLFEEAS